VTATGWAARAALSRARRCRWWAAVAFRRWFFRRGERFVRGVDESVCASVRGVDDAEFSCAIAVTSLAAAASAIGVTELRRGGGNVYRPVFSASSRSIAE